MIPAIAYPLLACAIGGLLTAGVLVAAFLPGAIWADRLERDGGWE